MGSDWVKKIIGFVVLGIVGVLAIAYLFMLLWNMLIPDLFNGPYLSFAKAIGLLVLAKILFGFGSVGNKSNWAHQTSNQLDKKAIWKQKLEEKMANMSEDEKEKLKHSMKGWCYGKDVKKDSKQEESPIKKEE